MSGITRDEWLKALHEAGLHDDTDDQGAVTVAEFADMMGFHRLTAERHLKALAAAGKATKTQKRVRFRNGRVSGCMAFRLIQPETPKAKRAR